ncbi:alpha/beta fold hydrolase [Mycobacterium hubeiense]|uniref:alpha/beta fold hydrolase n=1 Tax=Mycobacterium hubeiense TaxID=1867256 RepID=UPI000C7F4230|nr:alpha/beta hydrolase [Mycobacterium sp. QGD 101]
MPLPDLVLVHGGEHAADCWDLVIAELRCQAPELRTLAVDLPGRGRTPGDLATATIAEWVDSVVADIEREGLGEIVIVGHSMAGVTVPGVVTKLGSARVREMIFATAFVPPQGQAIVDTLSGPLAWFARRAARSGKPTKVPRFANQYAFCNGMTRQQRQFALARLYPESARIPGESVDRSALPADVPRTWILTTRDRALSQKSQRASIAALGGVQEVIPIDTCHDLMISHPQRLAQILVDRCRLYAT